MIEIRTFEGDAKELSDFVVGVWMKYYKGKMALPLWSADYFEWELLAGRPGRDYLVAAYDGSKLVGCLLGDPFRFKQGKTEFAGCTVSWLTIDPDYRTHNIGFMLLRELEQRHLNKGAVCAVGYVYRGSRESLGADFWDNLPAYEIGELAKVGFWARILDHKAVADWSFSKRDALLSSLLGLVQGAPSTPANTEYIRDYKPDDFEQCSKMTTALANKVDFAMLWDPERLKLQLQYKNIPQTIIYEKDGKAAGYINYYIIDFMAKTTIKTAVIDMLAFDNLNNNEKKTLILAALNKMKKEDVKVALLLRIPCYPAMPLLRSGFIPMPTEFATICISMNPSYTPQKKKKVYLTWR